MATWKERQLESWMEEMGYEWRELRVIKFLDDKEDQRWFYRKFDALGNIRTICDGPYPIDRAEVLRLARDTWGPEASVLMV